MHQTMINKEIMVSLTMMYVDTRTRRGCISMQCCRFEIECRDTQSHTNTHLGDHDSLLHRNHDLPGHLDVPSLRHHYLLYVRVSKCVLSSRLHACMCAFVSCTQARTPRKHTGQYEYASKHTRAPSHTTCNASPRLCSGSGSVCQCIFAQSHDA